MELGSALSGFLTGLREGVEAALIVSIILAYLAQTGNKQHFGKIWTGTALAIGASLAVGVILFLTVGGFEEPYEQLFEAGAMFLAAAVLTWMLFWMRRQARRVKGELQAAVDRALASGTAWGLAALAFTAVIREGIETALFLFGQVSAAAGDLGALSVLGGALAGLLVAAAVGWLIYAGSRRINYGTFFMATGLALIFIAAGLLSHAVHELIEVGWITVGTQVVFDISGVLSHESGLGQFLRALFGYTARPEVITLVVYLSYLIGVLWFYLRPVPVATVQEKVPASAG